ncbi:uncharacterized protein [Parasteatoda tepidariorum]|uniref:uncharacterized protein n=1 Tax=Parasteatoda tepidariorum TaxID=114398 RepID=UPI00077F9764|nr:uncharacterized protein LOC107452952 [Parasteatoda tepidariorum]
MDVARSNETQFSYKMHFHKTTQDLPNNYIVYNVHKNFGSVDASELSVENIINTVFFNCEDKKYAQICAQTYICHRIIGKATDLKLIPLFYRDHYRRSESLYEEPTYILIKNKIAGIAKNILAHRQPVVLLKRCSIPKRKRKTSKQKKQKKGKNYAFDESLRSIVGKFPSLIIPKLSPKEIEYHMKDKYRIFDLQKNSLTMTKNKTLTKTKRVKKNKENFRPNTETRRSSRLSSKEEKLGLNGQKYFHANFSLVSEKNILEDCQQMENQFQKDKSVSITNETYLQEDCQHTETYFGDNQLSEGKTHANDMTSETLYPLDDRTFFVDNQLCEGETHANGMTAETHYALNDHNYFVDNKFAEGETHANGMTAETHYPLNDNLYNFQEDNGGLSVADTSFNEDEEVRLQIPEAEESSSNEAVHYETDDRLDDGNSSVTNERNFQEDNECLSVAETSFNQDNKVRLQIPETEESSSDETVHYESDDRFDDGNSSVNDEQNFQENNMPCEFSDAYRQPESMVISEPKRYYEIPMSVQLRGNYTFEYVLKTQMGVDQDTCEYLNDEIGLDKNVIASLRDLYKSVHDGKNNYIFCELSY